MHASDTSVGEIPWPRRRRRVADVGGAELTAGAFCFPAEAGARSDEGKRGCTNKSLEGGGKKSLEGGNDKNFLSSENCQSCRIFSRRMGPQGGRLGSDGAHFSCRTGSSMRNHFASSSSFLLKIPRCPKTEDICSATGDRRTNRRLVWKGGPLSGLVVVLALVVLLHRLGCVRGQAARSRGRAAEALFLDGGQEPFNSTYPPSPGFVFLTPRKTERGLPPWVSWWFMHVCTFTINCTSRTKRLSFLSLCPPPHPPLSPSPPSLCSLNFLNRSLSSCGFDQNACL